VTDNPWIRPSNPLVIAHRGHSIALPENTMGAYERAVELGTDMIECDVNITRDGVLVMLHDPRLDRTTDGHGPVHDITLAEVERLDAGRWMGAEHASARVPTTDSLLRFAKDAGILMCFEVKGADDDEADRIAIDLVDLFVRHDALDWAFMSSYHHRAMQVAHQRVPELLLAPERLPDDVPADPVEASGQAARLGAPVLQNHWRFATAELVRQLHADGIGLWTWPTTELEGIELSLDIGADAVMGDDVPAMVDAVRRRTSAPA
jgi:glycerophosphoryl diester phosphodiesterase